jgi:hypothetical protein
VVAPYAFAPRHAITGFAAGVLGGLTLIFIDMDSVALFNGVYALLAVLSAVYRQLREHLCMLCSACLFLLYHFYMVLVFFGSADFLREPHCQKDS